jgi:hypothetical protein
MKIEDSLEFNGMHALISKLRMNMNIIVDAADDNNNHHHRHRRGY